MDKIALKKVGLLAGKMLMEEASVSKGNGSGLWEVVAAGMDSTLEILSKILPVKIKSKVAFLIPKTSNSGKRFNWKLIFWLVKSLFKLGTGYHVVPATGGWESSSGLIQHEDSYKFIVGIEEAKVPDLIQLLIKAKKVFDQEALYVEWEGKIIFL